MKHDDAATKTIDRAIEIFARGFTFTRSMMHPFLAERVGPVWVMRDGPRSRNGERYRTEEWIAYRVEPAEVDRIARRDTRGKYAICAIHGIDESPDALRAAYKRLGYRLATTEPLFVHALKKVPEGRPLARRDGLGAAGQSYRRAAVPRRRVRADRDAVAVRVGEEARVTP